MKKIILFLFFILMSVGNVFGATPGSGYSLVTSISSLSTGDYVILFSNQNGEGVSGYNGNKDATVSTTSSNWKLYYVTKSADSFILKDETANKFIASPGGNEFKYGTTGGACTVESDGLLTCNGRNLKKNGSNYRFYTATYTNMFYVYKVITTYTITAQSNNNSYGNVSLIGTTITATPNDGYRISTSTPYTVLSGTATVTNNDDGTFSVTPTSNCTITINFEAIPTYTVHFKDSLNEHYFDSINVLSVSLPTPSPTSICSSFGWGFAGWSESKTDFSDLKTGTYIPTQETTLYAVYRNSDGENSGYVLVEEDLGLNWGGDYLIAYSSTVFADGRIGGINGIGAASSSVNPSTNLSGKIVDLTWGDTYHVTLEEISSGSNTYLLKTQDNSYNYYTNNTNNGLSTSTNKSTAANYPITITFNSSENIALCLGGDATGSIFHYNSTSTGYMFRFYKNGGQSPVYFYKKQGKYTYEINPKCATVPVDTTTLPVDTIKIHIGETYELTPTIIPSNATNKNILWLATMPSIATVENGIVTGVAEGTAGVMVVTEDGNKHAQCVVIVLGEPNIEVAEWNPDWLKIGIDNFVAVTATLEDQNTQADIKQNYADKLFFSKYYEAYRNVKLWAVYNGTKDTISLSNVKVVVSSNGNGWGYSGPTPEATAAKTELSPYGRIKSGYICPGEEIIIYTPGNDATDAAIIECARDSNANFDDWNSKTNNTTNISGDDGLLLIQGSDTIDVIGGMNASEAYKNVVQKSWNDGKGWWCENGEDINGNPMELSTNRCLLVRKNTVHSGLNAVATNITNFNTLCSEWWGMQVAVDGDEQQESCEGFTYVGNYDYTVYYIAFDTIYEEKPIPGQEDDGYYKIDIPQLDTLSCTNLKISVKDITNSILEKVVKIPIMIKTNTTTTDATYFDKKECDKCDVVVLKDKKLTVEGTTSTNRDVKLYGGAHLSVPTGTEYTINSLSLRRENDTVSTLGLVGTLSTSKLYFDLFIDCSKWYWIALPGEYKLSDVKFTNGKSPVYGIDYWVRWYDGKYRAENKSGAWKTAPNDTVFQPGAGFIIGLSDDLKKKEFRFEITNSLTNEKSNKTVNNLHSWGTDNETLRPNHKGWNMVGNPFLNNIETDLAVPIRSGYLCKNESSGSWNGQWVVSDTTTSKLRYAVIPSTAPEDRDAGGYKSVVLDDIKLEPFTCFFVQIGGINPQEEQGIEFKYSSKDKYNSIIRRMQCQDAKDDELFLRIKVDNWKTGCFISNRFSEKYEPGDDLESKYPIYQTINGYKLLYSAINDSIIENGISVTSPSGYLYLDEKVDKTKFEYIYVNYNDRWYNLLYDDNISINNGTFILQAKRKKDNITTDLNIIPVNNVFKFTDGNSIYINNNGTILNVLGKKIF